MVVGHELRRLREAQGLSQQDAAQQLGISKYVLLRNEKGETPCRREAVLKALRLYRATPEEAAHLLEVLEHANRRRWWQDSEWRGVVKKKLHTLVTLEEGASLIRVCDRDRVPGLLQTAGYATAVVRMGMPGAPQGDIEKRVKFRLERQARFLEAKTRYLCLLDEVTLIRGYGTRETMKGQLDHLVKLSQEQHITLRIVELSRLNVPTIGQTILFDFEQASLPTVLYEDRDEGGLVCQEPDDVDARAKRFDRLLQSSLSTKHSEQRLCELRRKLDRPPG
ncbi:helix-turn-helix domain-containing protein [Streptomyces sp. NPDC059819]|uniref:helix-turn-helix domain-containing protein n=1 Tax=Streptomyces sp. NPDC059819 TaxID=3346963 RepID=UPI003668D140